MSGHGAATSQTFVEPCGYESAIYELSIHGLGLEFQVLHTSNVYDYFGLKILQLHTSRDIFPVYLIIMTSSGTKTAFQNYIGCLKMGYIFSTFYSSSFVRDYSTSTLKVDLVILWPSLRSLYRNPEIHGTLVRVQLVTGSHRERSHMLICMIYDRSYSDK